MIGIAIVVLLLEQIQIFHDPKEYFSTMLNYFEITGNVLVILTRWPLFQSLNWIMILLILFKAILTLRIFESQRTLI